MQHKQAKPLVGLSRSNAGLDLCHLMLEKILTDMEMVAAPQSLLNAVDTSGKAFIKCMMSNGIELRGEPRSGEVR